MSAPTIPSTQKAIRIHKTGDFDVVQLDKDVAVPEISDTQILVKNAYAGINFIENYFRIGLYPASYPLTLGREGAGEVVKVGAKVTKFAVGDKVSYVNPNAYAQYTALEQAAKVLKNPEGIDTKLGAASLLQGLTALTFVKEAYEVKAGDYILVHAAAGGTGSIIVQLAHHFGAHVIGTVSTPEKAQIAKENGADYIINYKTEDIVERVNEITKGQGVQGVFDGVGKSTFETSLAALARKGTLVSFGNASGPVPPVSLLSLSAKNLKILRPTLFNYIYSVDEWKYYSELLFKLIADKVVRIKVSNVYPLEKTRDGLRDLFEGKTTGKLLVEID
ncbi:uncharacterized protein SAPINGB_P004827 [Magnusiomyces paraingens]|uniref:Probable quinone oxidoreductase n=1 Tax=Magnusiomyces paraingens TaxID=2606893 RepID=A0A5E8C4P8_9ASCO|nr:uncharacterized protein SAPINGB_P004827 [Saprochaete ingens]VVT56116.1 unnamed protein product [Saprochaete ingens]